MGGVARSPLGPVSDATKKMVEEELAEDWPTSRASRLFPRGRVTWIGDICMDSRLDVSYLGTSSLLQLCRWLWPKDHVVAMLCHEHKYSVQCCYDSCTSYIQDSHIAIEQSKSPQRSSQPTSCPRRSAPPGRPAAVLATPESVRAHRVNHLSSMSFYVVTEA